MNNLRRGKTALCAFAAVLFAAAMAALIAGCGGGGRSSERVTAQTAAPADAQFDQQAWLATGTAPIGGAPDPANASGVSLSWFAPNHGDAYLLDIGPGTDSRVRQIEVRGIPSGQTVVAEPFEGLTSSASGSLYVATNIHPYSGYTLQSVTLDEGSDSGGVYYRQWIFFPSWAESLPLPYRIPLFAKITWSGGTYKAHSIKEVLALGHTSCYGPAYYDVGCQP